MDEIVERDYAIRHSNADGARHTVAFARGDLVGGELQACAVVLPPAARLLARFAPGFQFVRRAEAVIRAALRDEPLDHRAVAIETFGLKVGTVRSADRRTFVPIKTEPAQAVENSVDHIRRGSFDVGVFDAEDEHAAMAPREQPVEQRGARAADVEVTGWGWSESNADQKRACLAEARESERRLAVRQGFEPWIQLLGRITV